MRHLPLEPVPALLAQHRSAEAVLTNSQELFRAEFWHSPYLEIRLLLLVWEQTITHAFKAKPSCQVSVQSLTAIKSGEGSVALLSPPPPKPLDHSCPSHESATADSPQPLQSVCTMLIHQRRFVGCFVQVPCSSGLAGMPCQGCIFPASSSTHFSLCKQSGVG